MVQVNYTTKREKGKCLTYIERGKNWDFIENEHKKKGYCKRDWN